MTLTRRIIHYDNNEKVDVDTCITWNGIGDTSCYPNTIKRGFRLL